MNYLSKLSKESARASYLRLTILSIGALVVAIALLSSGAAAATTFTVNSPGDTPDAAAGDGVCADSSANCTLRAAIQEANALAGDDTINFTVTGTINLTGALPSLATNIILDGPGANVLSVRRNTGGDYRIFTVTAGATVNISGLTVMNGHSLDGEDGQGNFNTADAEDGGGIHNTGTLTLNAVAVSSNQSGDGGSESNMDGGGISRDGDGGDGGGIFNAGVLTLVNCTVNNNRTGQSGFGSLGANAGDGGGIANVGTLSVVNSTFSGNHATGNFRGSDGGAVSTANGSATFTACTITANSVGDSTQSPDRGGGISVQSGTATIRNTIIAGNTDTGRGAPDVSGTFNSQGFNLIQSTSGATINETANVGTNITGVNAGLGPLADNGGPTRTHALLASSRALDVGDNTLVTDDGLTTDQRGLPRRADSADADTTQTVDIGAFEAHPSIEDLADKTMNEDTSLSFSFNVGDAALGLSSVTATSSNTTLVPNDPAHLAVTGTGSVRTLTLTPATNRFGTSVITVTVTATNGRSVSDTFQLTVTGLNDPPTLDQLPDLTLNEDAATQTLLLSGISAGPNESQQLTVTATSSDTSLIPHPTIVYVSPNSTGTLSFTPLPNRNGGPVTITVTVTEGGVGTVTRLFNVTVNAINDAPVNTTPGTQNIPENSTLIFSGTNSHNLLAVFDVDAGANPIRVTLSATHATLTLGGTAGLAFTVGDGNEDAAMTFTGTVDSINAALRGLRFKPDRGFDGAASLQIVTDDLGHTGAGGALADIDLIVVNVLPGGTLQLSATSSEVQENGGTANITVTRTGGSAGTTSVSYSTFDGTAHAGTTCGAGVDYVHSFGLLSWADGETDDKTITVRICDDSSHEQDETLSILLSGVSGSADLSTATASLTIKDDDAEGGVFEFDQSDYAASESAGVLTVNVRRSGDTSRAAEIDYATDDGSTPAVPVPCSATTGLALDRCDFTKALGTLRFAAGETEKSFDVLLGDDSYPEGPEVVTLRLSNPAGGAVLGAQATAVLTIADDSPESAGNPIDDDEQFVRHHYHDFLNREPDTAGLQFWKNEIASCGADAQCREAKRVNVSAAFFLSIEYQETGYLAYRMYKAAYGNLPGKPVPLGRDEFLRDTQAVSQGVVVGQAGWEQRLAANKSAYAADFVTRSRFTEAFPAALPPAQFVDALNANAGGALSTSERDALVGALAAGTLTRAEVLRAVAEDETLKEAEFRRAFVLTQYFGYLRRNPDAQPDTSFEGWQFWLDKLNQFDGNFVNAEMVKAFILSAEYRQRFGQ